MIQSSPNSHNHSKTQRKTDFCTDTFSKPLQVPFPFVFIPPGLLSLFPFLICISSLLLYCNLPPHLSHTFIIFARASPPPKPPRGSNDWHNALHTTTIALSLASCTRVSTAHGMHMLIRFPKCASKASLIWFVILLWSPPSVATWLAEASCREKGKIASTEELTEEGDGR